MCWVVDGGSGDVEGLHFQVLPLLSYLFLTNLFSRIDHIGLSVISSLAHERYVLPV